MNPEENILIIIEEFQVHQWFKNNLLIIKKLVYFKIY